MSNVSLQRILVVEDDHDIQAVVRLALEVLGNFTVELCSSGNEALDTAPTFEPDLILLDVMMPGMNGPTTLHSLRAIPTTAITPIIFMTAKVQPHEIAGYKALGALDVIVKPFDPIKLSTTITSIWQSHYS